VVWNNNIGANSLLAERLRTVDGVAVVSTTRSGVGIAQVKPSAFSKNAAGNNGMTVSLMGIDPVAYPQVARLDFSQGNPSEAYQALSNGRSAIINGVFASTAGLKIGDVIPFLTPHGTQNYRVVAIASDIMNEKATTAYISQSELASDFDKKDDVFIQLNLRPGVDRVKVEVELKAILQKYPQIMMISGQAYFQQIVRLINTAFFGIYILFIFLAVPSIIAMLNTLAISVIERTREIGMLRALGATQKQIRRMILTEALLLAGIGTVFGLLAGLYLCYALIGGFRVLGLPVSFIFPWTGLLYATLVGLVSGALASIIPARQAARLEIIQALHYE
jgi:putative ABC transport system permease protein